MHLQGLLGVLLALFGRRLEQGTPSLVACCVVPILHRYMLLAVEVRYASVVPVCSFVKFLRIVMASVGHLYTSANIVGGHIKGA